MSKIQMIPILARLIPFFSRSKPSKRRVKVLGSEWCQSCGTLPSVSEKNTTFLLEKELYRTQKTDWIS